MQRASTTPDRLDDLVVGFTRLVVLSIAVLFALRWCFLAAVAAGAIDGSGPVLLLDVG